MGALPLERGAFPRLDGSTSGKRHILPDVYLDPGSGSFLSHAKKPAGGCLVHVLLTAVCAHVRWYAFDHQGCTIPD
jgi:hypothetical protein